MIERTAPARSKRLSAGRIALAALVAAVPLLYWGLSWMSPSSMAQASVPKTPDKRPASSWAASSRSAETKSINLDKAARHAQPGSAEARLLEIYRFIGQGQSRQALEKAQKLAEDLPNFQLGQMVYGDLLLARASTLDQMGAVPEALATKAPERLEQLRNESMRRLTALQERPPENAFPRQIIELPHTSRHVIAVDASRSRLYLFENGPRGLSLVSDHYASIGKLGADKSVQGDQKTPLGVYYITSRLEPGQLTEFYGVGALPLNYPNEYDRRLGRTGSGIWLHGVPPENYARSPQSTDGCVALANPELRSIMEKVQVRTTPVVIAKSLEWVTPEQQTAQRQEFRTLMDRWRQARGSGDLEQLMSFYSPQFSSGSRDLEQWKQSLSKDAGFVKSRGGIEMKDLAILGWKDRGDILVVTFGELVAGERTGSIKRQYWGKENGQWKIFYEGVIG